MRSRPAAITIFFVFGGVLGCAIGLLKAPDQPYWAHLLVGTVVGALMAFILDRLRTLQMEAFEAARHGEPARIRGLLARRLGGRWTSTETYGNAALEASLGVPGAAHAQLLADNPRFGPGATLGAVVRRHFDLVGGDARRRGEALPALLSSSALRMLEAERYRGYLLARAALEPHSLEMVERAASLLGSHRDREVRGYGQWVRAWHELPLGPDDALGDARRGAALAAGHPGLGTLAKRVDARASSIERGLAAGGPYRR
jgi:hypothetical protein